MKLIFMTLTLTLFANHGWALPHPVEIQSPWVRITAPGQKNTALFLTLRNNSDKDQFLVGASTDISTQVELHNHIKEGDVFKMRAVDKIVIPAKSEVVLKPGSLHIMFFNISAQILVDQVIPVTLNFEKADPIQLKVTAKSL